MTWIVLTRPDRATIDVQVELMAAFEQANPRLAPRHTRIYLSGHNNRLTVMETPEEIRALMSAAA